MPGLCDSQNKHVSFVATHTLLSITVFVEVQYCSNGCENSLFIAVITSAMSTFKGVNPYRWPGWAVTGLAAVLGIVVLLCFRETRSFPRPNFQNGKKCSGLVWLKLSLQLRSRAKIRLMVSFSLLLYCCCIMPGLKVANYTYL